MVGECINAIELLEFILVTKFVIQIISVVSKFLLFELRWNENLSDHNNKTKSSFDLKFLNNGGCVQYQSSGGLAKSK